MCNDNDCIRETLNEPLLYNHFLHRRFVRIPAFPHEKNFVEFIILRNFLIDKQEKLSIQSKIIFRPVSIGTV